MTGTMPEPRRDGDALAGRTALVIDDNADNRFVIRRWLGRHGLHVVEAETGAAGLELARSVPDVIVLDVRLGDVSGLEVARQLKADPATRTIPILQRSSAAILEVDQIDGLDAGADAYLVEPISERLLVAVVSSLVRFSDVQRQLETALSLDVSGVFDWSVTTDELRWTSSIERMHRMPAGSFGRTTAAFLETVHPDDRRAVRTAAAAALRDAGTVDIRYRSLRADGTVGWVEARGRVLPAPDGRASRVQGILLDVTEREVQRARAEQLQALGTTLSATTRLEDVAVIAARHRALADDPLQLRAIDEMVRAAVDRAARYEAERENASALQRALLPARLPAPAGWSVTAEYRAATDEARLGGDFYDVVQLGRRLVALVGDVAGHGLDATGQMGMVRSLLRVAAIRNEGDPAVVVQRAGELFPTVCGDGTPYVTAIVASIDLDTGETVVASAGHPAPVVRDTAGVRIAPVTPSPPLGLPIQEVATTRVRLAPGQWLAMYTDGVFERRREPLLSTVARCVGPLDRDDVVADDVLHAGEASSASVRTEDDRAVLVVRRVG